MAKRNGIPEMWLSVTASEAARMWCRDRRGLVRSLKVKHIRSRRAGGALMLSYRDLERAYGPPPNGIPD